MAEKGELVYILNRIRNYFRCVFWTEGVYFILYRSKHWAGLQGVPVESEWETEISASGYIPGIIIIIIIFIFLLLLWLS